MTIEHHTPNLETCQKLKEAGFPQETKFGWYPEGGTPTLMTWNEFTSKMYAIFPPYPIAAPILTEILEQLPKSIPGAGWDYDMIINPDLDSLGIGYVQETRDYGTEFGPYKEDTNPSEAAALLWLKLKEAAD